MSNPMMPQGPQNDPSQQVSQGQDQGAAPQGAGAPVDPLAHIEASYDKLRGAQGMLAKVRSGLDSLVTLADTVTQEDVIKVAGKLVGAGLTPEGMASLLAEMPENPEQLMQWISQHDKDVTQREQQLNQMTDQFRHELGVQAMKKALAPAGMPVGAPSTEMPQSSAPAPAGGPMSL